MKVNKRTISEIAIASIISDSLLEEVYTTPKPGLVDKADNGAHKDMDISTFERSTKAIAPYIAKMYTAGKSSVSALQLVFQDIRRIGLVAEKAMFEATGGVNTHKGAIFTLGILSASLGYSVSHTNGDFNILDILPIAKEMTFDAIEEDFAQMSSRQPVTHGEILYKKYHERGIRGQAQEGFPIIRDVAYPYYQYLIKYSVEPNIRNVMTLLFIIANLKDTNVIARSSPEILSALQTDAMKILDSTFLFTPYDIEKVSALNQKCISLNISPGGAADILAATLFLHHVEDFIASKQAQPVL